MAERSQRTSNLQQSFSNNALPSLPTMVPRPALKQKYHKLQRFGISVGGRVEKEEIVKPSVKNFTLNEQLRVQPNKQFIYQKKHDLVREWENLEEEERLLAYKTNSAKPGNNNNDDEEDATQGSNGLIVKSMSTPILRNPPRWVAFDREVLRFYMYFKEAVHESPNENFRVRKCLLLYYLSNHTIQIEEPKEENAGIPQGVFLKRTVLTKDDGTRYAPEDFMIGTEQTFYGRTFRIVNMDKKTRNYFGDQGMSIPSGEPYPLDSFSIRKIEAAKSKPKLESIAGGKTRKSLGQYLKNDNKVLRFTCVWDDTERLHGEKNEYSLHYFLSDDTIEVRNKPTPGSKSNPFPLLLKREKLLKDMDHPQLGYYTSVDLQCGQFINCYKRNLLLLSCDSYTEKFYERVHGIEQNRVRLQKTPRPVVRNELPPYNGFGSEADSLATCLNLVAKPVRQDLNRFLNNYGKELRFRARIQRPEPEEVDRRFVITFFMDDDTMAIYEPPQRNSGVMGGKFLERGKYKKPAQTHIKVDGATALQNIIFEKIQSRMVGGPYGLLRVFKKFCTNDNGIISFEAFKLALRNVGFVPNTVTDEQIFLLFKKHDIKACGEIDYEAFVDRIMTEKKSSGTATNSVDRWYKGSDIYIGAKVSLVFPRTGARTQVFEIIGADDTTLRLMENQPEDFPRSDGAAVATKLAEKLSAHGVNVRQVFRALDDTQTGEISSDLFAQQLKQWANLFVDASESGDECTALTEQEVVTLVRWFDPESSGKVDYNSTCDSLMNKVAFTPTASADNIDEALMVLLTRMGDLKNKDIRVAFKKLDRDSSGCITWNEFQQTLWSNGIELTEDELAILTAVFDSNMDGSVVYNEFCNTLFEVAAPAPAGQAKSSSTNVSKLEFSSNAPTKAPTIGEYKEMLRRAELQRDPHCVLKALMKQFSSGYFVRKQNLRKNFLAFDLDNKGVIGRTHFEEVLIRTNPDFPEKPKETLTNYFFPTPDHMLRYDEFMTIMFKNDVVGAINNYGPLN